MDIRKVEIKMTKRCTKVATLHGYTMDELRKLHDKSTSDYTKRVLMTIMMRWQGMTTTEIMKALGKSRPIVIKYIMQWNESPKSIIDNRGGNVPSRLTDEILDDITDILKHKKPEDYGYAQSTWTSLLISRYIEEHYGPKYGKTMMTKVLKNLGFSYKRGLYVPTKADPEMQEQFKKNVFYTGYF